MVHIDNSQADLTMNQSTPIHDLDLCPFEKSHSHKSFKGRYFWGTQDYLISLTVWREKTRKPVDLCDVNRGINAVTST